MYINFFILVLLVYMKIRNSVSNIRAVRERHVKDCSRNWWEIGETSLVNVAETVRIIATTKNDV